MAFGNWKERNRARKRYDNGVEELSRIWVLEKPPLKKSAWRNMSSQRGRRAHVLGFFHILPCIFSFFFFIRETSLLLCFYNFPQKLTRTHHDVALAEKNTPLLDNDKVQSSLLNWRLLFSIMSKKSKSEYLNTTFCLWNKAILQALFYQKDSFARFTFRDDGISDLCTRDWHL